jgi:thioredoxin reductase (NADPH)
MKAERDLIIIGAGAAGLAAAQYAARANLSPLLLEELASGGQALIIDKLENYPGFPEIIPGTELARLFEEQAVRLGAEIRYTGAQKVTLNDGVFTVHTDDGPLTSLALILATGASHRTLGVPGRWSSPARECPTAPPATAPSSRASPWWWSGAGTRPATRAASWPT